LSTLEDYVIEENDVFVIAIANIDIRKKCAFIIDDRNGNFISLIHQTSNVAMNTIIGHGCVIGRNTVISNDCVISPHCTFNSKAMVGHDSSLGKYCNINAGAFVGGECKIEDEVTIHTYGIVTPRLHIAKRAIVGAGSVVVKNVAEGRTVFGNPAKEIF
jgi:sugar O-acyltransferase (sialic acid O-acetyltransferase NeuD family)